MLNFKCFNSVINISEGEIKTSEIEGKLLSIHSFSFLFCDTYFKGNRLLGFLQQRVRVLCFPLERAKTVRAGWSCLGPILLSVIENSWNSSCFHSASSSG